MLVENEQTKNKINPVHDSRWYSRHAGLERTHGTSIWYTSELSSSQRVLLRKILAFRKEQLKLFPKQGAHNIPIVPT